jgi:hypothetical protein
MIQHHADCSDNKNFFVSFAIVKSTVHKNSGANQFHHIHIDNKKMHYKPWQSLYAVNHNNFTYCKDK